MPSPSSPLEYRPTPHLILIILFFVFPLIYIFARLALTACCLLAFVVKSMFSWLLQILYDYDELTPMTRPVEVRQRHQTPPTPTPSAASAVREGLVEISTSEEELIDESDVENELITKSKMADILPSSSATTQTSHPSSVLEIQTEGLHDSEHDSGNEEDPSAMSPTSTATTATNQTPDIPEAENLHNRDAFEEEVVQLRHRNNAAKLVDVNDSDDDGDKDAS